MNNELSIIAAWVPGSGFRVIRAEDMRRCDGMFRPGARVAVMLAQERSAASHRHYFATIADLWATLPEGTAAPYATSPEAFRKHGLISTGYADVTTVDAGSKAAAERVAATFRAVHRDYCIVTVRGPVVVITTAQSQSTRAMGAAAFQASKDAVLTWCGKQVAA